MIIERIVSEGLAHNSYLVGAGGAAAVIDPRRDIGVYLDVARRNGLAITHIVETHRNEDYCVGSIELAEKTGAQVLHGAQMDFAYGVPVRDGDGFTIGPLRLGVLETPGHTEESISLVLTDTRVSRDPFLVFTGDALFAGDVGRTDFFPDRLAEMAGKLHDSLWKKILPLGDGVIVCPAHGAGSVCGGEIADRPFTTIGYEKRTNPALGLFRDAFIRLKVGEHHYYPPYFAVMERYNRTGPPPIDTGHPVRPLSPDEVADAAAKGAQVVDIRGPSAFAAGHVPGSLSIWQKGISSFLGYYADYTYPVIFVDEFDDGIAGAEVQARRIGYDLISGYCAGGMAAWARSGRPVGRCGTCTVHDVGADHFVLDVRDIGVRERTGHIPGSVHIYAGHIESHIEEVPRDRDVYVICDSGFKASLAVSVLLRHGYTRLTTVLGGMTAWMNAGLPLEKEAAPS
jgi:hydroxyacylglutathione hydrolase